MKIKESLLKKSGDADLLTLILDTVMEHLPASIVVKDIESGFKYIYRNKESFNRNIPIQEAVGKDDYDFHPQEVAERKRKQDMELARTGVEQHWVEEQHDRAGRPLFLDKRKMRIDGHDGTPSVLLSIEWDITDLELMKRKLASAKEKAETSDRLKSAFLANMSHEIRTPLNAIVGFSQLIAETDNHDEREAYYSIVEENSEHLLQLINEILDLSKIEAGMTKFVICPMYLHGVCHSIYNMMRLRSPEGVELVYEPSDETLVVNGDKGRVTQVISNIVGNAFKFTTEGSVRYGYRRSPVNEKMAEIYVTDTGAGIPEDKLHQVFDRFVKGNDNVQGTGLGLSIAKTIVERLGGEISVSSTVGKGTTFVFTLPLTDEQPASETEEMLIV